MGVSCELTFSCIFNLVALVLVAVSFSTDYWLTYDVDLKKIKGKSDSDIQARQRDATYIYESRRRGLFRTCYNKDVIS